MVKLQAAIRRARRAVEAMRQSQSGLVACSYDAATQTVRFVNAEYADEPIRMAEWREALHGFACGGPFPLRVKVVFAKGKRGDGKVRAT